MRQSHPVLTSHRNETKFGDSTWNVNVGETMSHVAYS